MKEYHDRMAKRGRRRKVVDDMPPEGAPVEMVDVPKAVMRCPHCGAARIGQWERIGSGNGGLFSRCRACGTKVRQKDGRVFIVG